MIHDERCAQCGGRPTTWLRPLYMATVFTQLMPSWHVCMRVVVVCVFARVHVCACVCMCVYVCVCVCERGAPAPLRTRAASRRLPPGLVWGRGVYS